jgi:hypothetical protein
MPIGARRHLRKMRGGAQAHLLEAEDGHHYVVKFLNNPQHRRILVNELVGSCFLRYLQIAAPEPAIISISREFLRENPEACIQLGSRTVPVQTGWHFGSRYPGDPARLAVYDFLPDALLPQVANLKHFVGALVVDKWLANADARQTIYFRARLGEWAAASGAHPRKVGFLAQMIDHGFVFNGPHWEYRDAPLDGLAPRPLVYESVKSWDDFQPWLDQVTHFPEAVADQARKQAPPSWVEGDAAALDDLLELLMRRRRRVPDLLSACRRSRPGLFPNWR